MQAWGLGGCRSSESAIGIGRGGGTLWQQISVAGSL